METTSGSRLRLSRTAHTAQIRPVHVREELFTGDLPIRDALNVRAQLGGDRAAPAGELVGEGRRDVKATGDFSLTADDFACSLEWCLVHEQNDSTATSKAQATLTDAAGSNANGVAVSHAIRSHG